MPKKPPTSAPGDGGDYDTYRDRQAKISRERSAKGREIGPLPDVVDPARREAGRASLQCFCLTYFPTRFYWPFSLSHLAVIERMERCASVGGLFACAMPRASGKTAIAECAALWAILYGLRRFVLIVCATDPHATRSLKKLRAELEGNDRLAEDFPEACFPVRALERIHHRAKGQTLDGESTNIEWNSDSLILPTVPGSVCSGSIIQAAGITGAIRGLNFLAPDGEPLRPDMVLLDDSQTRASAKSPIQTDEREAIITDDVLGLAGPGTTISGVMLCTVIYPKDLSDRFLSPEKHPEWQGIRTKMLEAWPANMDAWDEYGEIRRESFRSGDEGRRANEFYAENRERMDAGAAVSWPERKKDGELSGIQSAMNIYTDNPRGFRAEYQNEPEAPGGDADAKELNPEVVAARLSGLARCDIPREASRLTAFIDCGVHLHWYAVIAWNKSFGGAVVDYGAWPRQTRSLFAADDPRPGLQQIYTGVGEDQALYAGLTDLAAQILGRSYFREGTGEELRVERCLIDCGWKSQVIYQFCRQTPHAGIIYPSKGIGRTSTARGISEWKPRAGEQSGFHWRLTMSETGKGRMVQFDPDAWKTFLFERLTEPMGGPSCLTFFGRAAGAHEMIGQHCAGEYSEPMTLRGTTLDKWREMPHRPDNHLFDCLVGATLAASVQGLRYSATGEPEKPATGAKPKADTQADYDRRRREFEAKRRGGQ